MAYADLADIQTVEYENTASCDNPCCILTLDNVVLLMGNVELTSYTANATFGTLPSSMAPVEAVKFPVCFNDSLAFLAITSDGYMQLSEGGSGTLYLNGMCFNACSQYYTSAIGNNFAQGTSPLRYNEEGSDV